MAGEADTRDALAAAWVAREDRGALDARTRDARDAWLRADPRHLGAYARARAVSAQATRAAATMGARGSADGGGTPRWLRGLALAAGVAAVAWLAHAMLPPPAPQVQAHRTGRGEILRMPLADGSVVTLDSETELEVAFTPGRRDVRLLRGEALFDVASDRTRPFVVRSAQATATAVGTSFSVSTPADAQGAVQVLVREGKVDVAAGARSRVARLEANETAVARPGAPIRVERLPPQAVRDRLAWREGMLAFQGDTLAAAARRFLRYSQVRIVIDDPALASRRVAGLYSANDPAGFARSVALSLGVVAERRGDTIHLRSPAPRPAARRE